MGKIGIRLEDKSRWERRVPIVPADLAELKREHELSFEVQTSSQRVYTDDEYRAVGAEIVDELHAPVVFAVKEIPIPLLREGHTYVFFAHVIKGQEHNMPLLQRLLDLRCTLIDYERIVDASGKRLVLFGREAGQAGMIDSLWMLGEIFAREGTASLLQEARPAHEYHDLADAQEKLADLGRRIRKQGALPPRLQSTAPIVFGFTGKGNVTQGMWDVFDVMEPEEIGVDDLAALNARDDAPLDRLFKVRLGEEHLVRPLDEGAAFDQAEYRAHPERYVGALTRRLTDLTVLMQGVFWTDAYPRFFTKDDAAALWRSGSRKLRLIGDVTCDLNGSIEMTYKATQPDEPAYVYHPETREYRDGLDGEGLVILPVDNFPCELPRDASNGFSHALRPFVEAIGNCDYDRSFADLDLPPEIRSAVITHQGELTPDYQHLQAYLDEALPPQ